MRIQCLACSQEIDSVRFGDLIHPREQAAPLSSALPRQLGADHPELLLECTNDAYQDIFGG